MYISVLRAAIARCDTRRRTWICAPFFAERSTSPGRSACCSETIHPIFPCGCNAQVFETQTNALYEIGITGATARLILHDNLMRRFPETKRTAAAPCSRTHHDRSCSTPSSLAWRNFRPSHGPSASHGCASGWFHGVERGPCFSAWMGPASGAFRARLHRGAF